MQRAARNPRIWALYLRAVLLQFRFPVLVFLLLVFGGGFLIFAKGHTHDYLKACYAVFALTFFENTLEFPPEWYLRLLWFATPIVGIVIIAEGIASFGVMLISRSNQLREWNVVVASSYTNHVIVCGVGKVGFCIVKELLRLGAKVVGLERDSDGPFVRECLDRGVPMIVGDAKQAGNLAEANVAQARAVIAATDDDLANLEVALTVRELNPKAQVVVRMFNPDLAQKISSNFSIPTISSSHTSAPAFAAAATHRCILHSFSLDGIHLHVADLVVAAGSPAIGRTLAAVQQEIDITVVLHKNETAVDLHPRPDIVLAAGDKLVVLGDEGRIRGIETLCGMRS